MKKAPQNKVPYFQCRCEARHQESSSTQKKDKQEISLDNRTEREGSLRYLYNPSAPFDDEELVEFTVEASQILSDAITQLEAEGGES